MNITTNPYSGYSQPQAQAFHYDAAPQQQPQPQAESSPRKYQDRVTLSGIGENFTDFFLAGHQPQLQTSFAQQQLQGETVIRQHLQSLADYLGLTDEKRVEIKLFGTGDAGSFLVSGAGVEEMERLAAALNSAADFKQHFSSAEQIKRLSVAIAKAKLSIKTLAQEGVTPRYADLQKIKEEVEQQFLAVSLKDGVVDFELVD